MKLEDSMIDQPYVADGTADSSSLGGRLRESRIFLQLSQADVANALGLQRTAIHAMEAGTRKVTAGEPAATRAPIPSASDMAARRGRAIL